MIVCLQPAINYLISVLKSTGQEGKKRQKKQQGPGLLLRPIICICNDLYVPSLRQLRQVALSISFPPTLPHKLASRLLEVSSTEMVTAYRSRDVFKF
jgi:chromosome transmission fidelity protein 18